MSNNKELPKEVVDKMKSETLKIAKAFYDYDAELSKYDNTVAEAHAKIAQSHYEPIIEDLKKGYEPLNNQLRDALKDVGDIQEYLQSTKQGKLGSSVLKEATKLLTEKDEMIEKLMDLLKHEHTYQVSGILLAAKSSIETVDFITNRMWNKFKQEHGL